jgi:hypothetical protein
MQMMAQDAMALIVDEKIRRARRKSYIAFGAIVAVLLVLFLPAIWDLVGQIYFSYNAGIPFNQVELAKQQSALWHKNIASIGKVPSFVQTERGEQISVNVCPSGDIFIEVRKDNAVPQMDWPIPSSQQCPWAEPPSSSKTPAQTPFSRL